MTANFNAISSLSLLFALVITANTRSQSVAPIDPVRYDWQRVSAKLELPASAAGDADGVVSTVLAAPGATLVRVRFDAWTLPLNARVRLTSLTTGETAEMTAAAINEWSACSPIFNGGTVSIDLIAGGPHEAAAVSISHIVSLSSPIGAAQFRLRALCGADDRVRENAAAIARLWDSGTCTASLIMTGEHMVSAGHCGPLSSTAIVEFDPPNSAANGARVAASPANQFPYVPGSQLRENDFTYDANDHIVNYGDDALVFRIGRNTNGETAGAARGAFVHLAQVFTNPDNTHDGFRKWGCGVAIPEGPTSRTMKRVDGEIDGLETRDSGSYWAFRQDTTGGDSGGPLFLTAYNAVIGVTSFGDVNDCSTGSYSLADDEFRILVDRAVSYQDNFRVITGFVDANRIYVPNGLYPPIGSIWEPSTTFGPAYALTSLGGRLVIAPGTYSVGSATLSRPLTIVAPFGPVTLTR